MHKGGTFKAHWSAAGSSRACEYERLGDKMPVEVKRMIAKALLREVRHMRSQASDEGNA